MLLVNCGAVCVCECVCVCVCVCTLGCHWQTGHKNSEERLNTIR